MTDKKTILRKYFHGLTDEQFAEDISRYPLANVLRAMDDYALQIAQEAVRGQKQKYMRQSEIDMEVSVVLDRILQNVQTKLTEE